MPEGRYSSCEPDGVVIVKIIIDPNRCTGCGECIKVCKSRNLEIRGNKCVAVRCGDCKLCMLCRVNCQQKAILIEV